MFVVAAEIVRILNGIKGKTSFGNDGIPNIVLKNLPIEFIQCYTVLFNNIINNGHYPRTWRATKVIPILKKNKDPTNPASYRPISLLPNISKIFEALLNQKIVAHCDRENVIPNQKFGFRYGHSTAHAINKVSSYICSQLNNHKMVAACLIDLQTAFDTVLPVDRLGKRERSGWRTFSISLTDPSSGEAGVVPRGAVVKYLGIHIDQLHRVSSHPITQLNKARAAFISLSKLFHNKYLNKRVKVICYMLLIRPIITYGEPVWFNQSASTMERLRVFERKCLRICLKINRSANSQYRRMTSNRELYSAANIPRIDNFIIGLTRNYFAHTRDHTNAEISSITDCDDHYIEACKDSGLLPPEAFIKLDAQGLIQNVNNVPIIYHWSRHRNNKKIPRDVLNLPPLKYDQSIPLRDTKDFSRLDTTKYWWLVDAIHLDEVRRRARRRALGPLANLGG
uniref:Reverse transcriptase domain-containing protein n=1 Tax=Trichogramma kaykai TaxID=54128 RepID=A0ABD2WMJ8_9HYME